MDEVERRLAAVELALVELIPWIDEDAVRDACAAIQIGLHGAVTSEEAEVRLQAIQLLTDGRRRYAPDVVGVWVRGG